MTITEELQGATTVYQRALDEARAQTFPPKDQAFMTFARQRLCKRAIACDRSKPKYEQHGLMTHVTQFGREGQPILGLAAKPS